MPGSPDLPLLRAAYSDRTAALMAALAGLAYDFPPTQAAGDSHLRGSARVLPAAFTNLGFERITYFHNDLFNGWAYVVEGPDLIVLAFRGTQSTQDWKTNFHVRMVQPSGTDPKLWVHEGFYNAFNALYDGHQGIKQKIASVGAATSGKIPIYITGHSLGGALAQIATAVVGSDQIAACYTFGSPAVGNKYFDLWVKPPSYRVINDADIVPQVPFVAPQWPPILYRHSGDARFLPAQTDGTVYRYEPGPLTRFSQILSGCVEALTKWSILGVEDHAILKYEQKLAAISTDRSQARDKPPASSPHAHPDGTLDFESQRIKRSGPT